MSKGPENDVKSGTSLTSRKQIMSDFIDHGGDFGIYPEGGRSHRTVQIRGGMLPALC